MIRVDKIKALLVNRYRHFFPLMLKIGIRVKDDTEQPMPFPAWITKKGPIELSQTHLKSDKYSEKDWTFILAHEIMHRILRHFDRSEIIKVKHHMLWNIATDLAINFLLANFGFTPPKEIDSLLYQYREYKGQSAETIYYDLLRKAETMKKQFEKLLKDIEKAKIDEHPQEVESEIDPVTGEIVRAALREMVEKSQGRNPGWLTRMVDEINKVEIAWYEKLRKFMTEESNVEGFVSKSYYPPSEIPNPIDPDIIMPRYIGSELNPVIMIDVSGSIPQPLFKKFLSHTAAIVDELTGGEKEISLGFVDADEPQFIRVFPGQLMDILRRTEIKGGGGTVFHKAFEALDKIKPDVVVFFTDGFADYPDDPPEYPVAWVMPEQGSSGEMQWGEVILIPVK